ncbi:hypothetical protein T484DRAFT_1937781 [Baffinella frigidus]|nr:hypothetical protein T484DRAFT_1937781 [Cryptophyta sp. CCMP2293]
MHRRPLIVAVALLALGAPSPTSAFTPLHASSFSVRSAAPRVCSMLGGSQFRLPTGRFAKLCRASISDIAASGEPSMDAAIPEQAPEAALPSLSGPPKLADKPPAPAAPAAAQAPPAAPKVSEPAAVSSFSASGTIVPELKQERSMEGEVPRVNAGDRVTGTGRGGSFERGRGAPRGSFGDREGGRGGSFERGRGAPRGNFGDREGGRGGWVDRGRGAPRGNFGEGRGEGERREFTPRSYDNEPQVESMDHNERTDILWAAAGGKAPAAVTFTQCGRCRANYVLPFDMLGETGRRCKCSVCDNTWFQRASALKMMDEGDEYEVFDPDSFDKNAVPERRGSGPAPGGGKQRHDRKGAVTLFVGNLPFSLSEEKLKEIFAVHGEVASASIIRDGETGRPRGFGFVDFVEEAPGKVAEKAMNGVAFDGRDLVVNISEDKFGAGNRGGRGGERGFRGRGDGFRGRGDGGFRGRGDGGGFRGRGGEGGEGGGYRGRGDGGGFRGRGDGGFRGRGEGGGFRGGGGARGGGRGGPRGGGGDGDSDSGNSFGGKSY